MVFVFAARVFSRFDKFVSRNPLLFSIFFATSKNTCADVLIQTQLEGRSLDEIDLRRLGTFAIFGTVWVGAAQFTIFNKLLPWAFPGLLAGKFIPAMKSVAFDQMVHMPFFYLPTFYTIRAFAYGDGPISSEHVWQGFTSWHNNLLEDTIAQCSVFVPLQCINFTFIPPHFRVPVVATAGFFWVMGLSFFRGDPEKDTGHREA